MISFCSLKDVVGYIMDGEDTKNYRWNNDAGEWDLEDILLAVEEYDKVYHEYILNIETYDIFAAGKEIFARLQDVA